MGEINSAPIEAMREFHFLFYSHEPAYKMTYDRRELVPRDSWYPFNWPVYRSLREKSLILISNRLNVAHPSQVIKKSFNHSTNTSLFTIWDYMGFNLNLNDILNLIKHFIWISVLSLSYKNSKRFLYLTIFIWILILQFLKIRIYLWILILSNEYYFRFKLSNICQVTWEGTLSWSYR